MSIALPLSATVVPVTSIASTDVKGIPTPATESTLSSKPQERPGAGQYDSFALASARYDVKAPELPRSQGEAPPTVLTVTFGDWEAGLEDATAALRLSNLGDYDLTASVRLEQDGNGAFQLVELPDPLVEGGEATTLAVMFDPDAIGTAVGELILESNDPTSSTIAIELVGLGVDTLPPASTAIVDAEVITQASPVIPIDWIAEDPNPTTDELAVELFYRHEDSEFESYGVFESSPIPFNTELTGGEGVYEFYTIAVDPAGNAEPTPDEPDSVVVFNDAAAVSDWRTF